MFYRSDSVFNNLIKSNSSGHIFPVMLGLLVMGSLFIIPYLHHMALGTKGFSNMRDLSLESYSSSSGIEHARWRLQFESGFADSINQSSTAYIYSYNINNRFADITINKVPTMATPGPTPTPNRPQSDRVDVQYSIDPPDILAGQVSIITVTITATNLDTSNVKFKQIGDLLPSGFYYIPGSASGFTSVDPTIQIIGGQQQLTWDWGTPHPNIPHFSFIQQAFRASVLPPEGFYYNEAWVWFEEDSIGIIYAPHPYPIIAEYKKYDIMSMAGNVTIKARLGKNDIEVIPLSWQR